jgi:hypothetical protein
MKEDLRIIVENVKSARPKGRRPVTKAELDVLITAMEGAMQIIWQDEKKRAALSGIEASKILVGT